MESFLTRPQSIKIRIRRNQRRAMSVGIFYWVGILLLLCFSIFPYVSRLNGFKVDNGELWIITFLDPIMALLSAKKMTSDVLMPAVVAILYILGVVVSLISAIVATTRLFRITKRNPTNKWGYNRAARAMKIISKCFALMFFIMFATTAIGVSVLDGRPTLFFYLAFAVALIFHFIGNFRGCKISFFESTEDRFNPIEKRRTLTRKISLARNTLQMVCIWLVILLTDRFGNSAKLFEILDGKQLSLIDGMILPAFMFVILGCVLVAIGHATSTVEYSEYGEKARGMKNCRNCAVVIAVLGFVGMVLAFVTKTVDQTQLLCLIGVFFVGLQWFFAEQMFATFAVKQEEIIAKSPEAEQTPVREKRVKKEKKVKAKKLVEEIQSNEEPQLNEEFKPEEQPKVGEDVTAEYSSETTEKVLDQFDADNVKFEEVLGDTPNAEETPICNKSVEEEKIVEKTSVNEEIVKENPVSETVVEEKPVAQRVVAKKPVTRRVVVPKREYVPREPACFVPNFLQTPEFEEAKKPKTEGLVFEELNFNNLSEEDVESLREKWLGADTDGDSETENTESDTRLLAAQQVHCPGCNTLLAVRFGLMKAKCSKCGTAFEMKKRPAQRYF